MNLKSPTNLMARRIVRHYTLALKVEKDPLLGVIWNNLSKSTTHCHRNKVVNGSFLANGCTYAITNVMFVSLSL